MKRSSLAIALSMLLLLALLAGCGASGSGANTYNDGSYQYASNVGAPAPSPAPSAAGYGDAYSSFTSATAADMASTAENPSGGAGESQDQKLIYTVNLSIETLDYDKSVDTIASLCKQYGGYVDASNVSGNGINSSDLRWASYTLRVPAGQLDAFQDACKAVGNITSASRSTANATAQYVDLQARLSSLQTEESRLLELVTQAQKLDDIIALNDRLADVRYQIESIQSSLRGIDSQVAYSTVNIDLSEVVKATEQAAPPRTFGERVSAAFSNAKNGFVNTMSTLGVFLFGTLPLGLLTVILVLLPFGIIALIVILIVRAGRRRRRARTAQYIAAAAPPEGHVPPVPGGIQNPYYGAAGADHTVDADHKEN